MNYFSVIYIIKEKINETQLQFIYFFTGRNYKVL